MARIDVRKVIKRAVSEVTGIPTRKITDDLILAFPSREEKKLVQDAIFRRFGFAIVLTDNEVTVGKLIADYEKLLIEAEKQRQDAN